MSDGGGVQWLHLSLVAVEAVGFAIFMIFVAPKLVHRLEPGIQQMQTHDAPLVLALALCLGLSVAATHIGMAAIIGAFFAGLAFADYSPRWNLEPRAQAINQFLSPFFFFTMGSRLDLSVFSRSVIVLGLALSVLAIVTKIVGCGLPLYREGWRRMLQVGVGMTPRGEVALIVALIGLQMNMISQRAYALVIMMTAITTILPPPFLKMLFAPGQTGAGSAAPPARDRPKCRSPARSASHVSYNPLSSICAEVIYGVLAGTRGARHRSIAGNRPGLRPDAGQGRRNRGAGRAQ